MTPADAREMERVREITAERLLRSAVDRWNMRGDVLDKARAGQLTLEDDLRHARS